MKTRIVAMAILICTVTSVHGQQSFKNFELGSGNINSMFENSKGDLWFYSNNRFNLAGFVTYDGSNCELKFLHGRKTFIPNITETSNGNLYFSNVFKGLVEYNGKDYTAINKDFQIPNRGITLAHADKQNRLWVFPLSGLAGGRIGEVVNGTYADAKGIYRTNALSCIYEDNAGTIWTGSLFGGFYKCVKGNWEKVSNTIVTEIRADENGIIWLASIEGKIIKYEGGNFTQYKYGNGYFYWTASAPAFLLGILPAVIWGYAAPDAESWVELEFDKNNIPWVLARKRGLVFIENEKLVLAEKRYEIPKTKKANSLFKDMEGNLWISIKKGGILKYDGETFKTFTTADGVPKKITGVSVDSKGNIWGMSKNGLIKISQ